MFKIYAINDDDHSFIIHKLAVVVDGAI